MPEGYVDRLKLAMMLNAEEPENVAMATGEAARKLLKLLRGVGVPERASEVHVVLGGAGARVTWIVP
jgi:hypothetical protein